MREPLLRLRGVSRRFDDGTLALDSVDLAIDAGEHVAIVGPSGSGKSTLLNLLGLLDTPTSGSITLAGADVGGLDDRARSAVRSADLAFVFQRAHLIPTLTVEANVRLGIEYTDDRARERERVLAALDRCGLADKADALARTLSGGEMQRTAIARALVRDARLWLADEPTGNLDSAQSVLIIDELREQARLSGAALVVVTHEPEIAARLERTITLRDGRVTADTAEQQAQDGVDVGRTRPRRTRGRAASVRAIRTGLAMLRARTPGARAGVVASGLAVALTVTALGLSQSAAAQVTSLFDARRAAQVAATLSRDGDLTAPWQVRVDDLRSFPGVTGAELWMLHGHLSLSAGVTFTTAEVVEVDATPSATSGTTITWARGVAPILRDGQALVGTSLARRLGLGPLDTGQEITVAGRRLRVVGLLESTRAGTAAGTVVIPAPTTLAAANQASLYVTTAPGAARQVADRLRPLIDPYGLTRIDVDPVLGPEAFTGSLTDSVAASLIVLAAVASLAGLGTVIFVNLLGITSRTTELGVRRALGAGRAEIAIMIATECTARALQGAVCGLVGGLTVILAVTVAARWEPVLDLRLLAAPLAGALVFGLLGGLAPAVHAARIEPADAVRS